jgi:phosphosulfolactate synthase
MPGGTLGEVALWQGTYDRYLDRARELGFTAIEVSDGTIRWTTAPADAIQKAVKAGFASVGGGRKDPADAQPIQRLLSRQRGLDDGAFMVIMEAREAGKGVASTTPPACPRKRRSRPS